MEWVARWYPRSHPPCSGRACLHRAGIRCSWTSRPWALLQAIILIGVGKVSRGRLEVDQYLLRDIREEPAALAAAFASGEEERTALVTYNGRPSMCHSFPPGLCTTACRPPFDLLHYDLLHFSRRRWKGEYR